MGKIISSKRITVKLLLPRPCHWFWLRGQVGGCIMELVVIHKQLECSPSLILRNGTALVHSEENTSNVRKREMERPQNKMREAVNELKSDNKTSEGANKKDSDQCNIM